MGVVYRHRNNHRVFALPEERWPFITAFIGIFLVGMESVWYHLSPDNETLVWDRLPMTIGFMSMFAIVISDRVSVRAGTVSLPVLLLSGVASVIYWHFSEQAGQGDLRFYILVQFLPMLVIPFALWLLPGRYSGARYWWLMLLWYLVAKLAEYLDGPVFAMTGDMISGHTLKHLAAAMAAWQLVNYADKRIYTQKVESRGRVCW